VTSAGAADDIGGHEAEEAEGAQLDGETETDRRSGSKRPQPAQIGDRQAEVGGQVAVGDLGWPRIELGQLGIRQHPSGHARSTSRRSGLDQDRFDRRVLVGLGRQAVTAGGVQSAVTGDLGHQHHVGAGANQVRHRRVAQGVGR
jgi:hypothetical protein